MNHWVIRIAAWSIVACSVTAPASARAVEVLVRLDDGRTLRGSVIESQTSEEQLALELQASGITVRQTLSWRKITSVRVIGSTNVKRIVAPNATRQESLQDADASPRENIASAAPPLHELLVHAEPVSEFGKMDWDSLRLMLRGVDQDGDAVPLFGTLRVTLWGLRQEPGRLDQNRYGELSHPVPRHVEEVGTWTRQLDSTHDASQFRTSQHQERNGDVVVLLPLTHPLPDQNARLASLGEVTVELLMPGVGVFSASEPNVQLSHASPLRQYLLDRDGTRFFPNEATTGNQQPFGSITNRALWPERRILTIQP